MVISPLNRLTWLSALGLALSLTLLCPSVLAAPPPAGQSQPTGQVLGTLLAAGDIADCGAGLSRWMGRTRDWLKGRKSPRRSGINGAAKTAAIIKRYPKAFVLALGDLAYNDGSPEQFKNCYDKYWGAFARRTFPAPGNHEYRTRGARGYYGYWQARAGPPGRGYYSFDIGAGSVAGAGPGPGAIAGKPRWHLVALNSEIDASPGSRQARWLRADLARSKAPCVLAYFHRPAFTSAKRSGVKNAKRLFGILHAYGASVVLVGHNHFYERTAPMAPDGKVEIETGLVRGIRSFVVGTGGAPYATHVRPAHFSRALIAGGWGVLKLELLDGRYRWQFLSTTKGQATDKGEAACVDRTALAGR